MPRHISRLLLVPKTNRDMAHDLWVIDGGLPSGSSRIGID